MAYPGWGLHFELFLNFRRPYKVLIAYQEKVVGDKMMTLTWPTGGPSEGFTLQVVAKRNWIVKLISRRPKYQSQCPSYLSDHRFLFISNFIRQSQALYNC